jgi:hypothetical protein
MPTPRRSPFVNPFFLSLAVVSTVFVATALAYWVSPMIVQKAADDPALAVERESNSPLIRWLDLNAPAVITFELGAMAVLSVLAMMTDSWFDPKQKTQTKKGL